MPVIVQDRGPYRGGGPAIRLEIARVEYDAAKEIVRAQLDLMLETADNDPPTTFLAPHRACPQEE